MILISQVQLIAQRTKEEIEASEKARIKDETKSSTNILLDEWVSYQGPNDKSWHLKTLRIQNGNVYLFNQENVKIIIYSL